VLGVSEGDVVLAVPGRINPNDPNLLTGTYHNREFVAGKHAYIPGHVKAAIAERFITKEGESSWTRSVDTGIKIAAAVVAVVGAGAVLLPALTGAAAGGAAAAATGVNTIVAGAYGVGSTIVGGVAAAIQAGAVYIYAGGTALLTLGGKVLATDAFGKLFNTGKTVKEFLAEHPNIPPPQDIPPPPLQDVADVAHAQVFPVGVSTTTVLVVGGAIIVGAIAWALSQGKPSLSGVGTRSKRKNNHHKLRILSLHDASAKCTAGDWSLTFTGPRTRRQIQVEFEKHYK